MARDRDFTVVGRALSDPTRSALLNLLMDGTRRPSGELAQMAGVSASTASEHLAVLVDAGLLTREARGRHRFYALSGPETATALESLGTLTGAAAVSGLRRTRQAGHLAEARFCYDHLAGRLGVALADTWVERGWLCGRELVLTEVGAEGLRGIGVGVDSAVGARRPTTRTCWDWTERRPHLAGALGAAVGARFLEAGWVSRRRPGRGLHVTEEGRALMWQSWGLSFARTSVAAE